MKIFMLVSSFPDEKNKSRGIFNYRVVKQLTEMGEQVTVVFFRMWMPGREVMSSYIYNSLKVTQVCLPLIPMNNYYILRINNFICRFFGWHLLKKQLKTSDIIHSVYLTNNGITAGCWAKKLNIPHVAQAIGSDVNSDMLELVKKRRFVKWIKNIDGIITNSLNLEATLKSYFPNHPEIRTIYRGIQVNNFGNYPVLKNNGTTFLYLGGLESNKSLLYGVNTKGGVTLMNAWKIVESLLLPLNATLNFGGPNSDISLFWNWKNGLEHPEKVNLLGKIEPNDVTNYLLKSDIVIVPSTEEGLPNFLIESHAYKKAAIASNAGGIPEVVLDGETGYIFNKADAKALAELLVKVASDPDKSKLMGEKAYHRVKDFFNADKYSVKILNFYKKIIKDVRDSGNG